MYTSKIHIQVSSLGNSEVSRGIKKQEEVTRSYTEAGE